MKKIILLLAIILFLIPKVSALEVSLGVEKIYDTYAYFYDENQGKNRYVYAEKYSFNNNLAYCLELGKKIYGGIYTPTTSFDALNISEDKLERLKLITYYGYEYPGHNTDAYFMAAQELIWNEMSNINLSWVQSLVPSKVVDVSKEKEEILKLIGLHYKKPSFISDTIEYTLGETLSIEDTNGVLNYFEVSNECVEITDNKLIIHPGFDEEEIILSKPSYTQNVFLLYTSGESQKMMSTGTVDNVEIKFKVKLTGGTLEVTKLDIDNNSETPQGDASLKGAIYELYDEEGNLKDTITIGTKNKLENIPLGKYVLKERVASNGYLLDTNEYRVEITKDNLNIKLNVYEEVIKRKVEIFKVLASDTTGELTPEKNITFEIYNKRKELVTSITTDDNGYASITLPYGIYTFKQTTSTKNYYKVEDFTINISEYDERPIYKLLSDSEIRAKVRIIKKDKDTKENIKDSSIKFKIFDVTNNKYLSLNVSYPENKETTIFEVDKNGIFITPIALSPGDYILEELEEKMDGYIYNPEKIHFTIGESSSFIEENNETYLEIPFYNKKVKGQINITKYGEEIVIKDNKYSYKEIALEKVTLHLYAKEDIYENKVLIYPKDSLVKEITTDIEGKVEIKDLPLGKYYLKEIKTIENHILEDIVYDVELKYHDEKTEIVERTIEIKNSLYKGSLTINKIERVSNIPIPNTLIEIRTKEGNIIYKGYTDQNGQIILNDLPFGEYYLSEIEASTGYRILEDKIYFEISSETNSIEVYNERIKVPNTGLGVAPEDIFVFICILIAVIMLMFLPKEKRFILISIIIIVLGITYFIIQIYKYYHDKVQNDESVTAYINNDIEMVPEEKYKYASILEVPTINLKRGVLDINNEYNNAKYNIELIKEDDNTIILAAHNGNSYNSFFGDLHTIELGDSILYYKDEIVYEYIYSESYDIKKNGYADIYRKDGEKSIILITCKDNTDDAQTVYIGYLKEESLY